MDLVPVRGHGTVQNMDTARAPTNFRSTSLSLFFTVGAPKVPRPSFGFDDSKPKLECCCEFPVRLSVASNYSR